MNWLYIYTDISGLQHRTAVPQSIRLNPQTGSRKKGGRGEEETLRDRAERGVRWGSLVSLVRSSLASSFTHGAGEEGLSKRDKRLFMSRTEEFQEARRERKKGKTEGKESDTGMR